MSKIKIQIKSVFGKVLFEYEKEYNTIKDTIEEAIKQNADLRSADLRWANLRSADLRSAKSIPFMPYSCPSDGSFILSAVKPTGL